MTSNQCLALPTLSPLLASCACRDLEERYLQGFFQHAVSLGRQAAASGAALRGEDGGSGAACLALMAAILGWDFQHSNNARTNIVQAQVRS